MKNVTELYGLFTSGDTITLTFKDGSLFLGKLKSFLVDTVVVEAITSQGLQNSPEYKEMKTMYNGEMPVLNAFDADEIKTITLHKKENGQQNEKA